MLQVVSGKFFSTDKIHQTLHRGTFYTNYRSFQDAPIAMAVGRLLPSTGVSGLGTFTYEITEKIEYVDRSSGTMVSTGGAELVDDVAAVFSFILNVICTTDPDLTRRLTGGNDPELQRRNHPRKYLRRVFDTKIMARSEDAALLSNFLVALVGLKRDSYDGAIRAIHRYVTATHRLADDTNLAYALFVMSIEALAQTSDAPVSAWSDYDESKRRRIDKAIEESPTTIAERVRLAVLKNEHVALARRFRDFAIEYLSPAFFRDDAANSVRPVRRPDLVILLKRAYDIRSGYVHRLQGVPRLLSTPYDNGETFEIDGVPTLTFEGLARLARHIIIQFVERSPKVEREDFNWHSALPNVLRLPLAPQYWIGHPAGYTADTATRWLQTFLSQVSSVLLRTPNATLTDLSGILDKIEALALGGIKPCQRRPILTLYHLFLTLAGPDHQRPRHEELLTRYNSDFTEPSVERLAICLVTGEDYPWQLDEIEALFDSYYRCRHHKNALVLGELLESMFTLRLAEAHRTAGNDGRARDVVRFSVEASPSNPSIRALEGILASPTLPGIIAKDILLPKPL